MTLPEAVEEVESVGGEEAQEVARDVQQSESVMVAATNDGKLEVKSDGCRCVEAALGERQLARILALAKFEEEAGRWGNSCLAVLWRQQQLLAGKVAGEFVRSSRSPPWYSLPYFQSLVKSLSGIRHSIAVGYVIYQFNDTKIACIRKTQNIRSALNYHP